MATEGTTSSSGHPDPSPASVVLTLTPMQAKALATLIGRSARHGSGLDAIRIALLRGASEVDSREPSSAASALAETRAFVAGAQVDLAATREAKYVAKSVSATKKSVAAAALKTAEAASHASDEKAGALPVRLSTWRAPRPEGKRHPDPGRCPRATSSHRRVQGR
jgi:hypothetical protein